MLSGVLQRMAKNIFKSYQYQLKISVFSHILSSMASYEMPYVDLRICEWSPHFPCLEVETSYLIFLFPISCIRRNQNQPFSLNPLWPFWFLKRFISATLSIFSSFLFLFVQKVSHDFDNICELLFSRYWHATSLYSVC